MVLRLRLRQIGHSHFEDETWNNLDECVHNHHNGDRHEINFEPLSFLEGILDINADQDLRLENFGLICQQPHNSDKKEQTKIFLVA